MLLLLLVIPASAQEQEDSVNGGELRELSVGAMRASRHDGSIQSREVIGKGDLIRAACCNLGESFTNSASVDVSYADPTTGVRQVKLLGLSGTYVQMMTENIPTFRNLALPYALGFVPGTWMQSIQVSKGASSVKNGYESMTGQINIEFLKPQSTTSMHANAYLDSRLRYELNLDGNGHLGGEDSRWSGGVMLHFDQSTMEHDMNGDDFMDDPRGKQLNGMARLTYISPQYVMQLRGSMLYDNKVGGQVKGAPLPEAFPAPSERYTTESENLRWDVHLKNAYIFNPEKDGNIALITSVSQQHSDNSFGHNLYDVVETDAYASLLFEEQFTPLHQLSAGLSLQHDGFSKEVTDVLSTPDETTFGGYAQYTFTLDERLTLMAGLRADRSSLHGAFVTPRAHLRWKPAEWFTMRASIGKGYRTPHVMPEYHYLLASSRTWDTTALKEVPQEESWNMGTSLLFQIPIAGQRLEVNADYYYTDFQQQLIVDRETRGKIKFYALDGQSYSHCLQLDATYPFFTGFELTAAWRMNHVRTTYEDGRLRETPLTSRWKGLLTASYKTPLELWQFDVTCQLNGPGRMPEPYKKMDATWSWDKEYKAFPQLSAQVTRFFRWGSLYAGGENLTNFHVKNPIVNADRPFSKGFDSNMIWGPVHGAMGYVGVRFSLEKY